MAVLAAVLLAVSVVAVAEGTRLALGPGAGLIVGGLGLAVWTWVVVVGWTSSSDSE